MGNAVRARLRAPVPRKAAPPASRPPAPRQAAPSARPGARWAPVPAPPAHLREHLDRLQRSFGASHLSSDPLQSVHRYRDAADIEIFGFYAAALAYGRVDQILASLERLARRLGPRPARFVRGFDARRDAGAFRGFVHRFHGPRDMVLLTVLLRRALDEAGTLGAWFAEGYDPSHEHVGPALSTFSRRMLGQTGLPSGPGVAGGRLSPGAPVRTFFSSPEKGSACKRLNLYLRWMVRREKGLDFGLWTGIPPSALVIPLDTHVARIAGLVGLTRRRIPDWRMALEVTGALRHLDPLDPVKYDFALSRLGILARCPRQVDPEKCAVCVIRPACRPV